MRLLVHAIVILALAAPALAAQQTGRTLLLTTVPAPPSRFEVLARSIDSASKVAESMQIAASERQRRATEASQMLFLSTVAASLGRRPNWTSAVTAIGVSQLWGSLKGDAQMAGFAGLTGGASWLLANLVPHAPLHFVHFRNVRIAR